MTSTTWLPCRSLAIASMLYSLASSALAAPQPPSLASEWQQCRTQFSTASTMPSDKDYPGGISAKGNQLTPPTIPGVTTVTVQQADCLIERMGKELVVAGTYSKGEALPYSYALPFAATSQTTFTAAEQALVAQQIATVAGKRMERPVLVYCHHESCMLSHNAAIRLVEAGYKHVFWMRDGVKGWKAAGLRVGTMRSAESPAMEGPSQALPLRDYQSNGYGDYPVPPWTLVKDGDRLTVNGKQFRTGRLCLAMGEELMAKKDKKAAEAGLDLYLWQAMLYEMAGVDPRTDNDVVERRKMQAFWREHGERMHCGYGGLVVRGSLLKYGLVKRNDAFVDMYLHQWRLPINTVDYTDGYTALDVLINAASSPGAPQDKFRSEYNVLRWLGGLTMREAEKKGVIPTERQLQASYIKGYEALAGQGNHRASQRLSWIYMQGEHASVNEAEAARWWELSERQALQNNDYEFMVGIGRDYMTWRNEHNTRQFKPMRAPNDAVAMQWYQRAAEGKSRSGMFHYGRGLVSGWGGSKDEAAGLRWLEQALLAGEDLAAVHMANVYARRGDVHNAARYGRSVHPAAFGNGSIDYMVDVGMSIGDYFKKNQLSWCGPRATGLEPRAASECNGN